MDVDPVLLKLIVTTTTLNDKINSTILDDGISWGHTPTIINLSESDALKIAIYLKWIYKLSQTSCGLSCPYIYVVIEAGSHL